MKQYIMWILTLAWGALIWRLTTIPDFHPVEDSLLSFLISNGGHLLFFGILSILIPLVSGWSLLLTATYGLSIEFVQRTIPGRSFSLLDLGLDIFGAIIFLAIIKKYENSRHRRRWLHRSDHS